MLFILKSFKNQNSFWKSSSQSLYYNILIVLQHFSSVLGIHIALPSWQWIYLLAFILLDIRKSFTAIQIKFSSTYYVMSQHYKQEALLSEQPSRITYM